MNPTQDHYMRMCASCALHIHGGRPPTYDYAINRTRRILYMTGAHESGGWQWRRQLGYDRDSTGGAFGLWQCELGSIRASLEMLGRSAALRIRSETWLKLWGDTLYDIPSAPVRDVLLELQEPSGDALSCLLARLHYYRVPEPFPSGKDALARYAKDHYNTHLGSATWQDYRDAYERGIA